MRVDTDKSYQIVYSLLTGNKLGPLVEVFAVQLTANDTLSLTYQRVNPINIPDFNEQLNDADIGLIHLIAEYSDKEITKKFSKKEIKPDEFMARFLTPKLLEEAIRPYIEQKLVSIFELLSDKQIYVMGKSGNPAQSLLNLNDEPVTTHFHFVRDEEGTRYYPTFRILDETISLLNKEPEVIVTKPCVLLVEDQVYKFSSEMDGKKLQPFFTKWCIQIKRESEPLYYRKFITSLIENHTVISKGFDIINVNVTPKAILKLDLNWTGKPALTLYFNYQNELIPASDTKAVQVKMVRDKDDEYIYYKINRQKAIENSFTDLLKEFHLKHISGAQWEPTSINPNQSSYNIITWLNDNKDKLSENGVEIRQDEDVNKYFLGKISLNISIEEKQDWFDIEAYVQFGNFSVPFIQLKKYILEQISEFPLPDGTLAIIPEEWFVHYRELMTLSQSSGNNMSIKRHHYSLLDNLINPKVKQAIPDKNFYLKYRELSKPDINTELPVQYRSILRPYQIEGFNWLNYLKDNRFGGCLADDMGLGKTIQTLALLTSIKEQNTVAKPELVGVENFIDKNDSELLEPDGITIIKTIPTLIVMPTSLIHNWYFEIKKWAPDLKILTYTGTDRHDNIHRFKYSDVILTTYGAVRNDIDKLSKMQFNYVILDESQVIKNPVAKVSQAVKKLKAMHKLTLSGTPIENSLIDLWSQMSFLNPGMLGSYRYFKDEFVNPIEKKNNEVKKNKLKALIHPFILRRTKDQVAKDLPELTEKIYFSEMEPEQAMRYELVRNQYRKIIFDKSGQGIPNSSRFMILKGLMQLRQIANHPYLADNSYEGSSGKFQDITANLENIISKNHRILVFSQFVKHLDLIRDWLTEKGYAYNYLTGQSRYRQQEIENFKASGNDKPIFLISLKAGGVGLNLTEADYVFMCDPWWNPATEKQAINRAHRIGQDKKVFAYKFITKNTVEEKILLLQERKAKLSFDLIQTNTGFDQGLSTEDIDILFS
ncbi:MAG: DEAD/DEAH box helicase [Bacteroidota bacterium]|nr:DEAD/DEAH box helicase [Bacteroidota bacterium]